mgnify:CR=1 FL=1
MDEPPPIIRRAKTLFDDYLFVDWSASSDPNVGKNSVWLCHARFRDNGSLAVQELINPSTRDFAAALLGGKVKNLGTYGTFNEAADAYKTAAAQYFGEFARPEVGEYKPPSIKRKVISAELPKRTVDAMSRMCGVRRGPLG